MPEMKASRRLADAIAAHVPKEAKEGVGIDIVSIIAALLTTLLPALLDGCKNNGKKLVAAAKKPSLSEEWVFRANVYSELRKAGFRLSKASMVADAMLAYGKSDLTEDDADDYLSEG